MPEEIKKMKKYFVRLKKKMNFCLCGVCVGVHMGVLIKERLKRKKNYKK